MAKTIDRETNSAATANDTARTSQVVDERKPVDEVTSQAQDGEVEADVANMPEDDQQLGVAPLGDERIATRNTAAGVQVPEGLLKSPLTRGLTEAYIELRKVTWPTRQDTWNMTIVVIVVSAIMAALLALSDYGLGHALSYLVNLGLGK